jgi:hypothetical protein
MKSKGKGLGLVDGVTTNAKKIFARVRSLCLSQVLNPTNDSNSRLLGLFLGLIISGVLVVGQRPNLLAHIPFYMLRR